MKTSKNKIIIGLLASSFLMSNVVNYTHASTRREIRGDYMSLQSISDNTEENQRIEIISSKLFSDQLWKYRICELAPKTGSWTPNQKLEIISNAIQGNNFVSNGRFGAQDEATVKVSDPEESRENEDSFLMFISQETKRPVFLITVKDKIGKLVNPYFVNSVKWTNINLDQNGNFIVKINKENAGFFNFYDEEIIAIFQSQLDKLSRGSVMHLNFDQSETIRRQEDYIMSAENDNSIKPIVFIKDETTGKLYLIFQGDYNGIKEAERESSSRFGFINRYKDEICSSLGCLAGAILYNKILSPVLLKHI